MVGSSSMGYECPWDCQWHFCLKRPMRDKIEDRTNKEREAHCDVTIQCVRSCSARVASRVPSAITSRVPNRSKIRILCCTKSGAWPRGLDVVIMVVGREGNQGFSSVGRVTPRRDISVSRRPRTSYLYLSLSHSPNDGLGHNSSKRTEGPPNGFAQMSCIVNEVMK